MASLTFRQRSRTLNFFVASLFATLIYQLIQLTIIHQNALIALAHKQHYLEIEIPPLRGPILDRKQKELAMNLKVPSIYAAPRMIEAAHRPAATEALSQVLGLEPAFVRERLARDKAFVWLKRRVSAKEAGAIQRMRLPYLGAVEESRRFYPQGDLLAQILGFANIDNQGLEGAELHLNAELAGRAGHRFTKRDAMGREIKAFELKTLPAVNGHRVHLTIDQHFQYLTERTLERAFKQWKAKGAFAVVMEAHTGRILALANRPSFDPNFYEGSPPETRRNRAVTDMYEPGSVFKIVAASAALNENLVTPETKIFCENGEYAYGKHVLHDVHAYGELSVEDVISKSSNIGTVKIASLMAPEIFHRYILSFGFGRPTGIDLPGEASGFVRPPKAWSKTSPYNIPIGQEVMVTALQMTTAMAVIANGGSFVTPFVIAKVEDEKGVVLREHKPAVKGRVLRPEVAAVMRRILAKAVEEGTGKRAKIDRISVAGKTGTAQKILEKRRGYSHSNFMSSFVGFAPAAEPEFVMAVVLDDPKPLYYGGTVAAPVFKEAMEAILFSTGYAAQTPASECFYRHCERPEEAKPSQTLEGASVATLPGNDAKQPPQNNLPGLLLPEAVGTTS